MYTEHTLASSNVKYVLTNSPTTNSLHACMLVLSQLVVSYCTKNGYANTTLEQLCIVLQNSTSSYYYYSSQYAYYYQQYQYIHVVVTATTRYYQQLHAYDTITTLVVVVLQQLVWILLILLYYAQSTDTKYQLCIEVLARVCIRESTSSQQYYASTKVARVLASTLRARSSNLYIMHYIYIYI